MTNATNSTTIESLLEIQRQSSVPEDVKALAKTLTEKLSGMPTLTKTVDGTVASKGYGDTDIVFGRRYKAIDPALHPSAMAVFEIMTQICPQSQLVQLPTALMAEDFHLSKPTILQALKELQAADYIRIKAEQNTRGGVPTTYMINPRIFSCAKPSHYQGRIAEYERLAHGDTAPLSVVDSETVKTKDGDTLTVVARYRGLSDKEKGSSSDKLNPSKKPIPLPAPSVPQTADDFQVRIDMELALEKGDI